ncbi:unnamed protein product [Danaus chrysippus]|uniref:glycogenin glucosyltransferase n=1 Tax=Danaus chrysippus TaxID=151541 RepID=A0A8J2R3U8_9NEOP|nr:unnamed protein product [Danaus chrysippus]
MSNRAWVTLATNDSYGLGALVLAHSLRRASSSYPAVVLITPSVTEPMRERLRAVFAEVLLVDVLDSKDAAHLALLQRPELGITFTKIHCWNLTQYDKCVFLDADTLIVQNCDELFEREELSAAPDVGWPDCFNSGVFVFKPSADTFSKLITFASERGSFDGGDQGLLNSYFSDWAHGDISKHLPFLYNVTSAAFYSYIPALKHYGQNLKIIHFIGAAKPWLQQFNWQSRSVEAPEHLRGFLQLWWDLFVAQVHSQLDTQMDFTVHDRNYLVIPFIKSSKSIHAHISVVSDRNNMCSKQQDSCVEAEEVPLAIDLEEEEPSEYDEPVQDYSFYEPTLDPSSEFPWHRPYNQTKNTESIEPNIDISEFHDPWHIYRGNIPPSRDDTSSINATESQRQYAWDYIQPQTQHFTPENSHNSENNYSQHHNSDIWKYNSENNSQPQTTQQFTFTPSISSHWEESQYNTSVHDQHYHNTPVQEISYQHDHYPRHSNQQSSPESQNQPGDHQGHHNNHQTHTNHQHFEHHQNNHQNYSHSQHYGNDHYQNNFTQQHFESHEHEQNQSYNCHHSSEHHHEAQSYHDTGFEQSHQKTDYYQDKHDTQSLFHNHSHSNIIENNKNVNNDEKVNNNYRKNVEINYSQFKKQTQPHIYTVMMDYERLHTVRKLHSHVNGCETEYYSNTFEDIPRHPYDGFYLRHRTTIDSRGRKICIHEIPLSPPSPTPSLESSLESDDENEINEDVNYDRLNGEESQTGVAGNLAKVVPGEPQQQEAVDELTRRQGWEAGNIDYMGADSFDNIWAKISQTLSQPPSSPPREPSPSKEPSEDCAAAAEEVKEAVVAPVESKPEESVKGSIPSDGSSEPPVAVEAPVVASEVDASIASTETVENVVSMDAAETVAPTETSESVPPPEAPACVPLPVASDCVSSPEVPATVEASEPVAQVEATECVSPPEASEPVAQNAAAESVSPPEASEPVAQIEATCVSSPKPSENIPIVETKETVAPPVADVNVASTEVSESVPAPETPIAPVESIDNESVPEPPAPENKDSVVPETSPAASIEEPVVDVPVPASEAAESSGKQEDPIPVPAEIAAVPESTPDESQKEMEPSGDIPVTAEEAIKIDIACVPKSSEMPVVENQPESPLNKSLAANEQSSDKKEVASDSPPLASTPSKEDIPSPPAAKTEERRKPVGKLSLPPASCDTLPTPDSELEDAASLAHAIIAGELRTPTVTSPSPPIISASPKTQPSQTQPRSLSIDQPEIPTPPLDSLSLSQIGVKSKPTIASQIETSVSKTEAPTSEVSEAPKPKSDAPKKKIVKKVVKKVEKEGGASDAPVPVPPPRKKEKKPKDK